jgi:hypothetical protein
MNTERSATNDHRDNTISNQSRTDPVKPPHNYYCHENSTVEGDNNAFNRFRPCISTFKCDVAVMARGEITVLTTLSLKTKLACAGTAAMSSYSSPSRGPAEFVLGPPRLKTSRQAGKQRRRNRKKEDS